MINYTCKYCGERMKQTSTQLFCDSEYCKERTKSLIKKIFGKKNNKGYKQKADWCKMIVVLCVKQGIVHFYIRLAKNKTKLLGKCESRNREVLRAELEKQYGKWRKRGEYPKKGLSDAERQAIQLKNA